MTRTTGSEMDSILDFLGIRSNGEFGGYRRSSLERRIRARASLLGLHGPAEYIDYLQQQAGESHDLFSSLFVHVTAFFRDPAAWIVLARRILLPALADGNDIRPLRIWNPGCSSGEETFTLLMLLERLVGRDRLAERVTVMATDIDPAIIEVAAAGSYDPVQLTDLPAALRSTYFRFSGERFVFREDLRALVTFRAHDLLRDPPMRDQDLVVCRNTLMYFDREGRRRVVERLRRALRGTGHLMTGRSELLLAHTDLFRAIDVPARLFAPVSSADIADSRHPEASALPA